VTQPEGRLSRRIMDALRKEDAFVFKVHGSEHMMAGLPDLICCYKGYFLGLETKMPGKKDNTSARQDWVHQRIRDAEGFVAVVTSIPEAIGCLRMIDSLDDDEP